jgi:hypothetical protein
MDVNNAIQETLGRSSSVPDDIDEHMGGKIRNHLDPTERQCNCQQTIA